MIESIGASVRDKASRFLYALAFFGRVVDRSLRFFRRRQVGYKVLVFQILFTGVEALLVNAVMAMAIGAAIIVIGSSLLPQFGQSRLMYDIMVIVITKELGPLLTAFIVIARSGTAIATELAGMVVGHEIEAYISVGVDPVSFLVVPRVIGMVASLALLSIYFNLFGLLGSFLVVQLIKPIAFAEYFQSLLAALAPGDILSGMAKSLVFGVIISTVASYQGFAIGRASTEIPVAGIKAVGQSFVLCIFADVLITLAQYA
ncbi:MAG: ABC transporter permease [Spirochaetales bacterium]|nr:ABC transporter permease [Spirochaetales bacterium]